MSNPHRLFTPADTNPLLDVLLARGVNGESPAKQRSMAPSPSPPRKKGKGRASAVTTKKTKAPKTKDDVLPSRAGKGATAADKPIPKAKTKPGTKYRKQMPNPATTGEEQDVPVAGQIFPQNLARSLF